MNVPPGIKNNQLLRLRGKGLPGLNRSKTGDLYIRINIETLTDINSKTKSLIQELKKNINDKIEFNKIKNIQ